MNSILFAKVRQQRQTVEDLSQTVEDLRKKVLSEESILIGLIRAKKLLKEDEQ